MKRCLIYFFFDKEGIVDRYVDHVLQDLKENVSKILFISNGLLKAEDKRRLYNNNLVDEIIERQNVGFDVWAYKSAIEHIGWDKLAEYDELIMMNYTIFGPIYPFKDMFDNMDKKSLDFWGITKFHTVTYDPFGTIKYGYIPEHIQSHFIAVRKKMLLSDSFKTYWENMPPVNRYEEAVGFHEAIFTKHFNDRGFSYSAYVNTTDKESITHYPLMYNIIDLIKYYKCPIFKRRSFFQPYNDIFYNTVGQATPNLYRFLKNETDYNLDLVWDNILRTENMQDIKNSLQLNIVLPKDIKTKRLSNDFAIMVHIYNMDEVEFLAQYLANISNNIDIYISVDSKDKKQYILDKTKGKSFKIKDVILVQNRGRDVSALLVGFRQDVKKYKYICFIHDKKTAQLQPLSIGKAFAYKCVENTLGSSAFIDNVINYFETNPRCGMLMPPPPNHSFFSHRFSYNGGFWGPNYASTCQLAKLLHLNVSIDENKQPISPLGTMFWFRTEALEKLFNYDWSYNDFPTEPNGTDGSILHAIERIYGFVSQDAGYYNAWVLTDEFVSYELTNLEHITMNNEKSVPPLDFKDQLAQRVSPFTFKCIMIVHKIRTKIKIGYSYIINKFKNFKNIFK